MLENLLPPANSEEFEKTINKISSDEELIKNMKEVNSKKAKEYDVLNLITEMKRICFC